MPYQRKPLAQWSPARDVWETAQQGICGHWAVWRETWPAWGMTVRGVLYELPRLGLHTSAAESSSAPLLPTPNLFHSKNTETPEGYRARRADVKARTGTQHGPSLQVVIASLLPGQTPLQPGALMPTPTAQDGSNRGGPAQSRRHSLPLNALAPQLDNLEPPGEQMALPLEVDWGPYAQAIARWEQATRPAPPAVSTGGLSARFVEWMMGLDEGWVTDVPGVSEKQAITALGNGVVPQQAMAAIITCLQYLGP